MDVASRQQNPCIICRKILFGVEAACAALSRVLHNFEAGMHELASAMRQQRQACQTLQTLGNKAMQAHMSAVRPACKQQLLCSVTEAFCGV